MTINFSKFSAIFDALTNFVKLYEKTKDNTNAHRNEKNNIDLILLDICYIMYLFA